MDGDRIPEWHQESAQRAPQIAEPDQTDRRFRELEAACVTRLAVLLRARAEGAIGRRNAARQVDRHRQGRLGDHGRERSGRAQYPDPALVTGLVIDIGEEVGLDVEDRLEVARAVQAGTRHCGVADQYGNLWEKAVDASVRSRPHRAGLRTRREGGAGGGGSVDVRDQWSGMARPRAGALPWSWPLRID